ncbi:MAG: peptidoglycan DD-metalloendopeptidase family protein [Oscillospiraceae bacterium]|nr:peptidoglycan DD-metalloendopeptidase family protein [Oscillospiraceae bacterium]
MSIKNNVLERKNERITSLFGAGRTVTIQGTTINGHSGIDFVPEGWVITLEEGEVIAVKDSVSGVSIGTGNDFGNYVHVKVNSRYVLRFCHLKQGAIVKVGQKLKKGARVGYMGTTGFSTGVHLHFEIRDNGVAIDPLPYLEGEIALSVVPTTPSTEPLPPANTSRHVIVAGDTMTKIAGKFGLSLNAANPQIKDINRIIVGQVINLLSPEKSTDN